MALNTCSDCTTPFAVGLLQCPHCRSTDFSEDEPMPKITVATGPSNAADAALSPDASAAPKFAAGGVIATAPSGSDEVPILLTSGESVLAAADVAEVSAAPIPDEVQDETKSIEDMSLAELRAEAELQGKATYGTKAELRERLTQAE